MLDNNDYEEDPAMSPAPPAAPPQWNEWGIPPNSGNQPGYMDLSYWISRGVNPNQIFDENGQTRPGWNRTARGYEQDGASPPAVTGPPAPQTQQYDNYPTTYTTGDGGGFGGASPNQGFQWPTLNLPRAGYGDFPGFKSWAPPTSDEILNDPVLQAQLKEGNQRIKGDRAFRGILNTGDTLKDIFDWTSDRIKLGGHDAFDRSFKVYDVNERQNPFNTWSANKDKYFQEFNTNAPNIKDEFLYNQYKPAEALWKQNFDQWSKTGDWLTESSKPPSF